MPPLARTEASTTPDPLSGKRFTVVFELPHGGTGAVEVARDEHILQAARRAGLALPSLCEQGWCTTCAVTVIEGTIDQRNSRRFYPEDRDAGFGLICTGKPCSNLRLKTHQSAQMRRHRRERGLPAPRAAGI